MKIFKGNRFTTPRFNYPVFKFNKTRGAIVGRNKLPKAWYQPYNRSFTLFEHSVKLRQRRLFEVCFRGFWHEDVAYPMSATVYKFNPLTAEFDSPELYVLDLPLPPYFANDYEFINPLEINEEAAKVFRFEPKFNRWFKDHMLYTGMRRGVCEKEKEMLIMTALESLPEAEVEKELMGVTLFEDTRAQWFGKLTFPMWSPSEDVAQYVDAIKEELVGAALPC